MSNLPANKPVHEIKAWMERAAEEILCDGTVRYPGVGFGGWNLAEIAGCINRHYVKSTYGVDIE